MNDFEFLKNLAGKQQEINDANSRLEEMTRASNAENTATSTATDTDNLFNVDGRSQAMDPALMGAAPSQQVGQQVGRQIEYNPSIVDKSAPDLNNVKVLDSLVKQMAQEYYGKLEKEGQRFGSPNSATDGATAGNQPATPQGNPTPTPPPPSGGGSSRYYEENTGSPARGARPSSNSRPASKKAVGVSAKSGGEAKFKTRPSKVSPNDPTISAGEMRPDGGFSSPAPEGYTRDVQLGLVKNSPEVSDETWKQATRMENPVRSIDRQRVLVGPGRSAKPNSKAPASGYYDPAVNKVLRGEASYSGPEVSPTAPVKPSPSKVQQAYEQSQRRPSDPRAGGSASSEIKASGSASPKPPVNAQRAYEQSQRKPIDPRAGGAADRSTPQPIKVKQISSPSGRETALDQYAKEIASKKSSSTKSGPAALPPAKNANPKALPSQGQTSGGIRAAREEEIGFSRQRARLGAKPNGQRSATDLTERRPRVLDSAKPTPLGPKSSSGVPSARKSSGIATPVKKTPDTPIKPYTLGPKAPEARVPGARKSSGISVKPPQRTTVINKPKGKKK